MSLLTSRRSVTGPGPFVAMVAALLVAATFVPLGYILVTVVNIGWSQTVELVRPRAGELSVNTAALIGITAPCCVLLGVGLAWIVERTDIFGSAWWGPVFAAPLAVPAFVNSYALVGVAPALHGLPAGVIVAVMSYFPLVYLPAAATLRRLDPAVEESARALGSGPVRVFVRIVVPQLRLAILGGVLLTALHLLAEYGAFAMLRFDTFTTVIFERYQSGAAGSAMAGVLVLCCLALLGLETLVRGRARYARIGSGAQRYMRRIQLRYLHIPVFGILCAVFAAVLGIPLWTVGRWLRVGGTAVWNAEDIFDALGQTMGLAALAAAVTTVCAFPVAWIAVRSQSRTARFVEGTNYVTSSLPGIVIALAMVTVTLQQVPVLYQTVAMITAGYLLMYLPRAVVGLRAGLAQVPVELEESARSLGRGAAVTFLRVTLRLAAPAAATAAALVFVAVATELTATLLLAPIGTQTLAMRFWSLSGELDYAKAAPYALLLVLLSLPVTYLLFTQSRKAAGER